MSEFRLFIVYFEGMRPHRSLIIKFIVTTTFVSLFYLFRGNHPYNWETNSSPDTALSILLNLCYTQSVRSTLKEVNTFRTLVHIAEYSEKFNDTRNPAEDAQMTTQCIKAVRI